MLNIKPDSQQYIEDLHYDGEGDEFYHKYENQWIAIVNKHVVAFGNDPLKVKKKLHKKPENLIMKSQSNLLKVQEQYYNVKIIIFVSEKKY
ncbi:MAG: hypothetical protein FVQ77_06700 [Cytophagales bacterium]|nr:hypothetical protein [Cytophagales bacterium]